VPVSKRTTESVAARWPDALSFRAAATHALDFSDLDGVLNLYL